MSKLTALLAMLLIASLLMVPLLVTVSVIVLLGPTLVSTVLFSHTIVLVAPIPLLLLGLVVASPF